MKETIEKQAVDYSVKDFPELLSLALTGDKKAAAEIAARQAAKDAEIELLKIKANSKRTPKAEKTPSELAAEKTYYRAALLVKQFGVENVNLQTLTVASAYFDQGLAQGNLRQALNRVTQFLNAQKVEETVFPDWILTAAEEIPVLDENRKLEEEADKVAEIKAIVQKYMDNEQQAAETAAAETAAAETAAAETAAQAAETPAKKAGGKAGGKK